MTSPRVGRVAEEVQHRGQRLIRGAGHESGVELPADDRGDGEELPDGLGQTAQADG